MNLETKEQIPFGLIEDLYLSLSYIGGLEKSEISVIIQPYHQNHRLESYVLLKCFVEDTESKANLEWMIDKAIKNEIERFKKEEKMGLSYNFEIITKEIK